MDALTCKREGCPFPRLRRQTNKNRLRPHCGDTCRMWVVVNQGYRKGYAPTENPQQAVRRMAVIDVLLSARRTSNELLPQSSFEFLTSERQRIKSLKLNDEA